MIFGFYMAHIIWVKHNPVGRQKNGYEQNGEDNVNLSMKIAWLQNSVHFGQFDP